MRSLNAPLLITLLLLVPASYCCNVWAQHVDTPDACYPVAPPECPAQYDPWCNPGDPCDYDIPDQIDISANGSPWSPTHMDVTCSGMGEKPLGLGMFDKTPQVSTRVFFPVPHWRYKVHFKITYLLAWNRCYNQCNGVYVKERGRCIRQTYNEAISRYGYPSTLESCWDTTNTAFCLSTWIEPNRQCTGPTYPFSSGWIQNSDAQFDLMLRSNFQQDDNDDSDGGALVHHIKVIIDPCMANCLNCTEKTKCNLCDTPNGWTLYQTRENCVTSCDDPYYDNGTICTPCMDNCKRCRSGPECDECNSPYVLHQTHDKCVLDCDPGWWEGTLECQPCLPNCRNCTNATICEQCFSPMLLHQTNMKCVVTCDDGYYNDSLRCLPCHETCKHCNSDSATDCTECWGANFTFPDHSCRPDCPPGETSPGPSFCNFPCPRGFSQYPDNSCTNQPCIANFPQVNRTDSGAMCPFICPPGTYLYQNGSCLTTCDNPFVTDTQLVTGHFCNANCNLDEFMYPNGTCLPTCSAPNIVFQDSKYQKCMFPCGAGQYLYQDGTCKSDCPSGFFTVQQELGTECNFTCSKTDYLKTSDNTCGPCPSPYVKATGPAPVNPYENYCKPPCDKSANLALFPDNSCRPCVAKEFKTDDEGDYLACNLRCPPPQYYLPDATLSCSNVCNPPMYATNDAPSGLHCRNPCPGAYYFTNNGTCKSQCAKPFTSSQGPYSQSYCNPPCPQGQYYYSDGTCKTVCPSPYIAVNDSTGAWCNFPCPNNTYLSCKGTCDNFCSSPNKPRVTSTGKYCEFTCPNGQYLYDNQTCKANCTLPFMPAQLKCGQACKFKCSVVDYYYPNSSCIYSCEYPMKAVVENNHQFCDCICPADEYLLEGTTTCVKNCTSPNWVFIDTSNAGCAICNVLNITNHHKPPSPVILSELPGGKTAAGSLLGLTFLMTAVGASPTVYSQFLNNIQRVYMVLFYNVSYPSAIFGMGSACGPAFLNMIPNPFEDLINSVDTVAAPKNFFDNGYTGLFMQTAGLFLTLTIIILGVYIVAKLMKGVTRFPILSKIGTFLTDRLQYSFMFRFGQFVYNQVTLAALLQLANLDNSEGATVLSYVFAMFSLLFMIGFPSTIMYRVKKNIIFKNPGDYMLDYDTLGEYKRYFVGIQVVKQGVLCLSLVELYYVPILQVLVPLLSDFMMIVLMMKWNPFNSYTLNLFVTVTETMWFSLHMSIMVLAYCDTRQMCDELQRTYVGYVLVIMLAGVLIASLLMVLKNNGEFLLALYQSYTKMTVKKRKLQLMKLQNRKPKYQKAPKV